MSDAQLIGAAIAGIALLLFLIVRVKLHAFVALLIGSLVISVAAGMPFADVLDAVTTGVGSTLASIAVVVGLGAMFGQMLEVSGGVEALADSLLNHFGERNAQWSLLAVGFVVAILPNDLVAPEKCSFITPAPVIAFVIGFVLYAVLAKAGLQPEVVEMTAAAAEAPSEEAPPEEAPSKDEGAES